MATKMNFTKILEPGLIGKVMTRNRIIKVCGGAEDLSPSNNAFHEALARGGTGLIIYGDVAVEHPYGKTFPVTFRHLEDDKYIPAFAEIAQIIHRNGGITFMQLFHAGPQARLEPGLQTVSSSTLTESEVNELSASMAPRQLTIANIHDLVDKFASTAVRARKAGFDGVEINSARMHLLNSFLSRAWNKRHDAYGCDSLENRARIVVEIIQEIKKRLGADFPVVSLINGIELGTAKGITIEEAKGLARIIEAAGADAIHVRAFGYQGWGSIDQSDVIYYSPTAKPLPEGLDWSHKGAGALVPLAAAVKQVVSVPVIAVSRMDPILGEKALEEGKADYIAMCRRLMADPAIVNKLAAGRYEDIVSCEACGECGKTMMLGFLSDPPLSVRIRCRVNAALGNEQEHLIRQAPKKKKVVVVGGGPAGMEAARVAAIRGHDVALYEKEDKLGGQLPWVAMVRGNDRDSDANSLVKYLKNQINRQGVKIVLGEEFNSSVAGKVKPDAVILATGGIPVVPQIPGIKGRNVIGLEELHSKLKTYEGSRDKANKEAKKVWDSNIGKKVVILGCTIEGFGLAEFLMEHGREVTILDTGTVLKTARPVGDEMVMRQMGLRSVAKPAMLREVKYEEITNKGLTINTKEGKRQTIEADTIVLALTPQPDTELLKSLEGKVPEVYIAGSDGKKSNSIMNAIGNGHHVAKAI